MSLKLLQRYTFDFIPPNICAIILRQSVKVSLLAISPKKQVERRGSGNRPSLPVSVLVYWINTVNWG